MRIVEVEGAAGTVETSGVRRQVALDLAPEARVGDWVIVHAGYAIQVLDEEAAAETLALLAEVGAVR
jgi:hydrogenase expression/formation protein HypC